MTVTVAITKESVAGEKRVALDPSVVKKLVAAGGFQFRLQHGCGISAGFADVDYGDVVICSDFESTVKGCDIVLRVGSPTIAEAELLPQGCLLASSLFPHANLALVELLLERRITSLALELMPRISRAHSMNVTSSQGTVAGYKAALLAAELSPRLWPMVITPAGTVRPSTVVVVGAGVAGLQSIATARRLGARVEAYDIRVSAREQVESLGASMIETGIDVTGTSGHGRALNEAEKQKQIEVLAECLTKAHAVICTAALPGRAAPRIINREMVEGMPRGAVIVDLAARTGGNCDMTEAGKTVWVGDKRVVGAVDLAGAASVHASELYSRNMLHLLNFIVDEGTVAPPFDDQIMQSILLTHDGEVKLRSTARQMGLIDDDEDDSAKPAAKVTEDNTSDWIDTDSTRDTSQLVPESSAVQEESKSTQAVSDAVEKSRSAESGRAGFASEKLPAVANGTKLSDKNGSGDTN